MRYSEIIGIGFHNIGLPEREMRLIDAHAIAAAHHRLMAIEPGETHGFHLEHYEEHVRAIFRIVHGGDFSHAQDPMNEGREKKSFWALEPGPIPDDRLPDPQMFHYMPADARYPHGGHHPYDLLLEVEKSLVIHLTPAVA